MKDLNLEITKDAYTIDNDWYYAYAKKVRLIIDTVLFNMNMRCFYFTI